MKTTHHYAKLIQERMNWEIVDDNVFAYDGETIEKIGDKKWRYAMKNTQKESLYRFVLLDAKEKTLKTQDFSEQNYFDCDKNILADPKYNVEVTVLPAGTIEFDKETINKVGMVLRFMKYGSRKLGK
jgi:hypothetical protein